MEQGVIACPAQWYRPWPLAVHPSPRPFCLPAGCAPQRDAV